MGCFNIGSFCVNTVEREWERRTARWETEWEWAREKERVLFYFHFFFYCVPALFSIFPCSNWTLPKGRKKMFCFLISLASNQVTKYLPTTKVTSYEKITIRKKRRRKCEREGFGGYLKGERVGGGQKPTTKAYTQNRKEREWTEKNRRLFAHTFSPFSLRQLNQVPCYEMQKKQQQKH